MPVEAAQPTAPSAPSRRALSPAASAASLQPFALNDLGLSLIERLALALFPGAPSAQAALAWLQVGADTVNILLAFWLGWMILDEIMGLSDRIGVIYEGVL